MGLNKFHQDYLNPLMEKLSNENKKVFLIGDFNVDLMKIAIDVDTSNIFDVITANLIVPHIIHPTRIKHTRKTLIDNIYSNSVQFQDGVSAIYQYLFPTNWPNT